MLGVVHSQEKILPRDYILSQPVSPVGNPNRNACSLVFHQVIG
jgi:hypothetical protein